MEYKFDNVPIVLYIAFLFTLILFPVSSAVVSDKIKETIYLLKTNRNLIHTVRTILEIFPDGVLIRSLDPITKQTICAFANDIVKNKLFKNNSKFDDDIKIHNSNKLLNVDEFLKQQEFKCEHSLNHSKVNEQLIELRRSLACCDESKQTNSEESKQATTRQTAKQLTKSYYSVKTIKVSWEDNQHSYLHVFIDTTQIKKLEEERAKGKCQQLMFTSISHELRTPLNAFVNSTQLIGITLADLKKRLSAQSAATAVVESLYPKFEKFLKVGEVSSKLLMVLVEDILDFVKFSSNTFTLNVEQFRLQDLLAEIDFVFGFQCEQKKLRFDIECDADLRSMMVKSDARRIKQVLTNLISNSYKFTEVGGIAVRVKLVSRRDKSHLQFSVVDSGVGISEHAMPKLFRMFGMTQSNGSLLGQSGSGIGLSISKMIVESLGGEINVASEEGKWTDFSFTIQIYSDDNFQILNDSYNFDRDQFGDEDIILATESEFDLSESKMINCNSLTDYNIMKHRRNGSVSLLDSESESH